MSRELTKPNNRLQGDRSSSCDWPEISNHSNQGFLVIRDPWGILSVEATNQWLVRVLVCLLECCPENIQSFCLLDDEGMRVTSFLDPTSTTDTELEPPSSESRDRPLPRPVQDKGMVVT